MMANLNSKYQIPFEFILDYLYPRKVTIKPMFGCFGVYVNEEIVLFLRDRKDKSKLNGVWIACATDSFESLSKDLPSVNQKLKLVESKKSSGKWLLISVHDNNFEALVIRACELILKNDPRIGKKTENSLRV